MGKIRVTHINPTDTNGGASLAGYRLHKEFLKQEDIDSILFVAKKYSTDEEVIEFPNLFTRIVEKGLNFFNNFTGLQYFLSINWINLIFKKKFRETDIFIIRNIHGAYLPFWFPWVLSKFAPVIWRLPDQWSYTGHCTYSYDCDNWLNGCGNCDNLQEYPKLKFDTTRLLFKLKKYFYSKSDLYMVGPSNWMCDNLSRSPIFSDKRIEYIPIGINTNIFKPMDKFKKFSISFVSVNLDDYRKGGTIIESIFCTLNDYLITHNILIDIYMIGKEIDILEYSNINYIFTGYLDEEDIIQYYAKTHINIIPTLADNLPNTILESLSCGTPVVSFDTGGCKDLVKHFETGYLSKYNDTEDFVNGIVFFIENKGNLVKYSFNARKFVERHFTMEIQTEKYISLIKEVMDET